MIWEDFFPLDMVQPCRCKTPCFREFQFRLMVKDRFVRVTVFEFHDSLVFWIYMYIYIYFFFLWFFIHLNMFFSTQVPVFFLMQKKLAGLNFNLPGAIWDARLDRKCCENLGEHIECKSTVVNYLTCMLHLEVSINLHQSSFYICCCFLYIHSCYDMLYTKTC